VVSPVPAVGLELTPCSFAGGGPGAAYLGQNKSSGQPSY